MSMSVHVWLPSPEEQERIKRKVKLAFAKKNLEHLINDLTELKKGSDALNLEEVLELTSKIEQINSILKQSEKLAEDVEESREKVQGLVIWLSSSTEQLLKAPEWLSFDDIFNMINWIGDIIFNDSVRCRLFEKIGYPVNNKFDLQKDKMLDFFGENLDLLWTFYYFINREEIDVDW